MGKAVNLLKNLRTHEVSLVDNGAIGEEFLIIKREGVELDAEMEEIRKELGDEAFNEFLTEMQSSFEEHIQIQKSDKDDGDSKGLFSTIIKKAWELVKSDSTVGEVKPVDFIASFKEKMIRSELSNKFWDLTDSLRETIYSILGSDAKNKDDLINETLNAFKEMITGITSNVLFQQSMQKNHIEEAISKLFTGEEAIEKVGRKISSSNKEKFLSAVQMINDIINEGDVSEDMLNVEDIQKAVTAALAPVMKKVEDLEAKVTTVEKKEEEVQSPAAETVEKNDKQDDVAATLAAVIQKAMEPVMTKLETVEKRLETVEKSEETSRKLTDAGTTVEVTKNSARWPSFSVNK